MEIGDNSSISSYTTIYAAFGVKIGKNCLISSNCGISSINHIQNSLNRRRDEREGLFCKSVIIGDNVWIGMNAAFFPVLKSATIPSLVQEVWLQETFRPTKSGQATLLVA